MNIITARQARRMLNPQQKLWDKVTYNVSKKIEILSKRRITHCIIQCPIAIYSALRGYLLQLGYIVTTIPLNTAMKNSYYNCDCVDMQISWEEYDDSCRESARIN